MQNANRKFFDSLVSRNKIYLVIILLLLIVICVKIPKLIVPSFVLLGVILSYTYFANNKRKNEISETLEDLVLNVDTVAKSTLINSPFPLMILETDGNVIWRSSKFVSEFEKIDMDKIIDDIIVDFKKEINEREKNDKKNKMLQGEIKIGNKTYEIIGKFANSRNKKNKDEYMLMLYFIDNTENKQLKQKLFDSKSCACIIMIDNYEENMQLLESEEKPQLIAEIDKIVYEWANSTNGILLKTDRDRYVYIFEQRYLEEIKEDKFSVLDKIKEINTKDKVQFTLSIAISNEGDTNNDKYKSAQAAMDVVLGRGGDQAVIRENEIYRFFGARTKEVEKRTKVKARVVANALENLISESDKILIMGHKNPDIDVMGSAMGIFRLAQTLNKKAYIVGSEKEAALDSFKQELMKDVEYEDIEINKEVALENMGEDTLLVVVDTNKKNHVIEPEVLKKAKKIVVIDHHIRSADYIENATITFQEVYASSTAELVTEILQYTKAKVNLKQIEAESLYAGIMMDTKNFTFKTGVRTFEAAAYLRKCGIDIIRVKKWFQSDLEGFNKIADIVKTAQIVNNSIAIAIYPEIKKDTSIICAKAADELLTISNITASFVLGNTGEKICISGRSIGDINVQIILEKLGGGGHMTLAGAQLEGVKIEEAKQKLIEKINEG